MQKDIYKGESAHGFSNTALGIELGVNTFLTRYRSALPAEREALRYFE